MMRWRSICSRTSTCRRRWVTALTDLHRLFPTINLNSCRQSDDPAVQWQMNLYKGVVVRSGELTNPEHTVDRIQSISAAVFHLEQVNHNCQQTHTLCEWLHSPPHIRSAEHQMSLLSNIPIWFCFKCFGLKVFSFSPPFVQSVNKKSKRREASKVCTDHCDANTSKDDAS